MKHYRSIDLLITAAQQHAAGKLEKAASLFDRAVTSKDFPQALAYLERRQQAAYVEAQPRVVASPAVSAKKPETIKEKKPETAGQRLAAFLTEVAAKKAAAKKTAKSKGAGLPFGGKMAPPFKKKAKAKAKASPDSEIFQETMNTMSEEDAGLGEDLDGLTVQDIDGVDAVDEDGVEELPTAGTNNGQGESDLDTDMDDTDDAPRPEDGMDDLEMDDLTAESEEDSEDGGEEDVSEEDEDQDVEEEDAAASDEEDEEEDDSMDEDEDTEEDEDKKEDAAAVARVSIVSSNLKALDRLAATTAALRAGKFPVKTVTAKKAKTK